MDSEQYEVIGPGMEVILEFCLSIQKKNWTRCVYVSPASRVQALVQWGEGSLENIRSGQAYVIGSALFPNLNTYFSDQTNEEEFPSDITTPFPTTHSIFMQ